MVEQTDSNKALKMIIYVILALVVVYLLSHTFNYFRNLKKDITMNDIKIEVIQEGTGASARVGDEVIVNYVGTLESGFEFDNSYKRGSPIPVTIGEGRVIKGWEKGLLGIKVGEKRKLTIPPTMGYGDREIPNLIPANSVLIFEVEAVEINLHG